MRPLALPSLSAEGFGLSQALLLAVWILRLVLLLWRALEASMPPTVAFRLLMSTAGEWCIKDYHFGLARHATRPSP